MKIKVERVHRMADLVRLQSFTWRFQARVLLTRIFPHLFHHQAYSGRRHRPRVGSRSKMPALVRYGGARLRLGHGFWPTCSACMRPLSPRLGGQNAEGSHSGSKRLWLGPIIRLAHDLSVLDLKDRDRRHVRNRDVGIGIEALHNGPFAEFCQEIGLDLLLESWSSHI